MFALLVLLSEKHQAEQLASHAGGFGNPIKCDAKRRDSGHSRSQLNEPHLASENNGQKWKW
jgi:hypothetical protein